VLSTIVPEELSTDKVVNGPKMLDVSKLNHYPVATIISLWDIYSHLLPNRVLQVRTQYIPGSSWDDHHSLPTATLEYSKFILRIILGCSPLTFYLLLLWNILVSSKPNRYYASHMMENTDEIITFF